MFDAVRNVLASPIAVARGMLGTPGSRWKRLGERDEEIGSVELNVSCSRTERVPAADKENARMSEFSFQSNLKSPSRTPLARRTPLSAINGDGGRTPASQVCSVAGSARTVFESPCSNLSSFGPVDLTPPPSECSTPPQLGKSAHPSSSFAVLSPPLEISEVSVRESVVTLSQGISCLPGLDQYGRSTPIKSIEDGHAEEDLAETSRPPLGPLDANGLVAAARPACNPQAAALALLDDYAEEASAQRIHAAVSQAKAALGSRRAREAQAQSSSHIAERVSIMWAPRAQPTTAPATELIAVAVIAGNVAEAGQPQERAEQQQAALNRKWELERDLRKTCDNVDDLESKLGGMSLGAPGGR